MDTIESTAMSKSSYRHVEKNPRRLLQYGAQNPVSEHQPFNTMDGRVAALHPTSYLLITTPNVDYIPTPVVGKAETVFVRDDLRLGEHDPTQWPQHWNPEFPHLPCIPRKETAHSSRSVLWASPLKQPSDFVVVSPTCGKGLGQLTPQLRTDLKNTIHEITTAAERTVPKDLRLTRQLLVGIDHFHFLIENRPLPYYRTLLSLRCLQRAMLELDALVNYYEHVVPVFNGTGVSQGTIPPSRGWIGAFTSDTLAARRLCASGCPVWLLWSAERHTSIRCFKIASPQMAADHLSTAQPAMSSYCQTLYDGPLGHTKKYLRIRDWAFVDLGKLFSPLNLFQLPSRPSGGALPGPATSSQPVRQRSTVRIPGGNKTFKVASHQLLCPVVRTWGNAQETIDVSTARCMDLTGCERFIVPRPDIFVSSGSNDGIARSFASWLRVRPVILAALNRPAKDTLQDFPQISHQAFRIILHEGTLDVEPPRLDSGGAHTPTTGSSELFGSTRAPSKKKNKGSGSRQKEARNRDDIAAYTAFIRDGDPDVHGVPPDVVPEWLGSPFVQQPVVSEDHGILREITWELAELGFRIDLVALDAAMDHGRWDSDKQHQAVLRSCFRIGGRSLLDVDLGMANTGLAEADWMLRAPFLFALKILVSYWKPLGDTPAPASVLTDVPRHFEGYTEAEFSQLESDIAWYINEVFFRRFRRPLILPPTLPLPGALPAHISFDVPPIMQLPVRTAGRWLPTLYNARL
ncbi:hypothetical protein CYLTODRAFT_494042 [Cylindrobasidium torrendii FP15055 ss-10]|uniref:Uncharacterized protein n=1 Tax=Cylindrobasidium torrendii FP15055 ss-10 TaxID=1314674 RepID=A0A0D7B172_9AGAR|nr:hypothetical protein CYLTODRAFT_494042 [Cylindrobasidium torrendii FP15055 ss-10]